METSRPLGSLWGCKWAHEYCCSRAVSKHYKQDMGSRNTLVSDENSVKGNSLVDMNKVLLSSFHRKLGPMKNFERVLNKNSAAFPTRVYISSS